MKAMGRIYTSSGFGPIPPLDAIDSFQSVVLLNAAAVSGSFFRLFPHPDAIGAAYIRPVSVSADAMRRMRPAYLP